MFVRVRVRPYAAGGRRADAGYPGQRDAGWGDGGVLVLGHVA